MWYDVFVVAVLVVGMVRGAAKGVVWQLAGIAGIVLCLVFAETISAVGAPHVNLEPPLDQWVVMFVAYLVFSFLSFGFARLITSALEKAELKEYNKHLGAIFGLVKGAALCLVITFFLVTLSETTRSWLKTSRSARYAAVVMDRLHPVMPGKLREALAKYIHDLDVDDLNLRHAAGADGYEFDPSEHAWDPLNPGGTEPTGVGEVPSWNESPIEDGAAGPPSSGLPTTAEAIDTILRQIPALANDPWTRETAQQVYRTIPESSRQRFLQDVKQAAPAMMLAVLQRWRSQPPQPDAEQPAAPLGWGSTENVSFSNPPAPTRESLLTDIASTLARNPQDQPAYEQYISAGLNGLPDAVSLGVLLDWQADLAGGTDPDPKTSASTTLDERIISQLTIQRVSVFQLSQELQTRLMNARRQ